MILQFCRNLILTFTVLALSVSALPQVGPMQAGMDMGHAPMTAGSMIDNVAMAGSVAGACTDCGHQPMSSQTCATPCQTAIGLPIELRSALPLSIVGYTMTPQRLYAGIPISPDPSPPRTSIIA